MPFFKPDFSNLFSDISNEHSKVVTVIYRLGLRYYLVSVNNKLILHHPPVNEIFGQQNIGKNARKKMLMKLTTGMAWHLLDRVWLLQQRMYATTTILTPITKWLELVDKQHINNTFNSLTNSEKYNLNSNEQKNK